MRFLPRRCPRLLETARDIALLRGEARALAPAAVAAMLGLGYAFMDASRFGAVLVPTILLLGGLVIVALFDARYFVIPDGPIYALAILGAVTVLVTDPQQAAERLAAALFGYGALWGVAYAYERLRGAAGLGLGDARLFALAGLWLGFEGLPSCLLYAVASALLGALIAARAGALDARAPIPFGPHLALGFWLCWVVGPLQTG